MLQFLIPDSGTIVTFKLNRKGNLQMENEKVNPIGELMQTTMENVRNILQVDTVVGDPIVTPDGITLVPISKISIGFGGGGVEFGQA